MMNPMLRKMMLAKATMIKTPKHVTVNPGPEYVYTHSYHYGRLNQGEHEMGRNLRGEVIPYPQWCSKQAFQD